MSDVYGVAVTGLNAFQTLLATTSHNITNAATEGYSRQRTELTPKLANLVQSSYIGSGVEAYSTSRIVDNVLIDMHRSNTSKLDYYETQLNVGNDLNGLLSQDETGLDPVLDDFFNALQDLGTQPPSPSQSQILLSLVMNNSEALVDRANAIAERVQLIRDDIRSQYEDSVTRINTLATSIKEINSNIVVAQGQAGGGLPNDLYDLRDNLLNELAVYIDVKTVRFEDGHLDVYVGTGQSLIIGDTLNQFSTSIGKDDPEKIEITSVASTGLTQPVTEQMTGGKIGGLNQVDNELVLDARNQINRVLLTLSMTVNEQHRLGVDANGELGEDFFTNFNDLSYQYSRSVANSRNTGSGILKVSINDILRAEEPPYTLTSNPTGLQATGSLNPINVSDMIINRVSVGATNALDDSVSTADNAQSAIAIAAAINTAASGIGVNAKVNRNVVNLGTFTAAGAMDVNQFVLNGVDIASAATNAATIVQDINSQAPVTGVKAELDAADQIILTASDGRNIQLETVPAGGAGGSFAYYDTSITNDQIARASVTMSADINELNVTGFALGDLGFSASSQPSTDTGLTDSNYQLTYDGTNYILRRLKDSSIVASSFTPDFSVDGFSIELSSGTIQAGDKYLIKPLIDVANTMSFLVPYKEQLALSPPVMTSTNTSNNGTGTIRRDKILDTSGTPATSGNVLGNAFQNLEELTPPIRIEFFRDQNGEVTRYRLFDTTLGVPGTQIGPEQEFIPNKDNDIFPVSGLADGANATYSWDPGYRVSISGAPQAGDEFFISYNNESVADFFNAVEIVNLQTEALVDNYSTNFQSAYATSITIIGARALSNELSFNASDSLYTESKNKLLSFSGVNIDEEAANLLQYQNLYTACAQIITVSNVMFNALIQAVG